MQLSILDDQISNLNSLNRASAKALDTFADTSDAIAARAQQITLDIKPWEVAQENITRTIEEMAKAARCYQPPASLSAVLAGRERNPAQVARCVDYLVYASDYLGSHPPNDYGDQIQMRADAQLNSIVSISEDLVRTAFVNALQRATTGPTLGGGATPGGARPDRVPASASSNLRNTSGLTRRGDALIRNPNALLGIDEVIQRLGENFNQLGVVQDDVVQMLGRRMAALVNAKFDVTYMEEETGKAQTSSSAAAHMQPNLLKHYQRGTHKLLAISEYARALVTEMSECLNTYVLTPLQDDYAVVELPAQLAEPVCTIIVERAFKAIAFDHALFNEPTAMFIRSNGQGVGMFPAKARYLRDIIFVGLNLVEELWRWKELGNTLAGDNNTFIDYIELTTENFLGEVRELLEGYANTKGQLQKELLVRSAKDTHRAEWLPAMDCTAHESTANMLYLHKVLLSNYFGSLKLALYGTFITSSADLEAVRETQSYIVRCALGSLQDLQVIADATQALLADWGKSHRRLQSTALASLTGAGGGSSAQRFNAEIFMINNVVFLEESYRREPCFTLRGVVVASPDQEADDRRVSTRGGNKGGRKKGPPRKDLFLAEEAIDYLRGEKERCIDDFVASWETCFPPSAAEPDIASIDRDASNPLRKSQRMAVKHWYKKVSQLLSDKVSECNAMTVMDGGARARLIEGSVSAVREGFAAMDDILLGRTWSTHPQKWMPNTLEDWIDKAKLRMDRVFSHSCEPGGEASRHALQMKEFKLEVSDTRQRADPIGHKERRGFRAQPKLTAGNPGWGAARGAGGTSLTGMGAGKEAAGPSGGGEEDITRISEKDAKHRSHSIEDTTGVCDITRIALGLSTAPGDGAAKSRFRANSKMKKGHAKGPTVYAHIPATAAANRQRGQKLLVEGNSVLCTDAGTAAQALGQLSECVKNERRLREEMEQTRLAKIRHFQTIVRAYIESLSLKRDRRPRAFPDSLAIARCSVITNALLATVQANLRAVQSCLRAAAIVRSRHDLTLTSGYTARAPSSGGARTTDEGNLELTSRLYEDVLGVDDINELKQLYFDYFDCEAISISTPTFSCTMNSDYDHDDLDDDEDYSSGEISGSES